MLIRFITAGSVDDGKSTLIGRMLFESKNIYADQLANLTKNTKRLKENTELDLSLLTDGLEEEQERGITIDVAYRYFSTAKRKFIIADSPGHQEYTRNMITAASTADVMIILIDAARLKDQADLLMQTKRHSVIAKILRIENIFLAVNKMDAVNYDQGIFSHIAKLYLDFANSLGLRKIQSFPISALKGDNITSVSANMPWYTGPNLLAALEAVDVDNSKAHQELRMPIQMALDLPNEQRLLGRIESGILRLGEEVMLMPSRKFAVVQNIFIGDSKKEFAVANESISLCLSEKLSAVRGDLLVSKSDNENLKSQTSSLKIASEFRAEVCWLSNQASDSSRTYFLKCGTKVVPAKIDRIESLLDVITQENHASEQLQLNQVAMIEVKTEAEICFDPYTTNKATGSFILIDPENHQTLAAGMIQFSL